MGPGGTRTQPAQGTLIFLLLIAFRIMLIYISIFSSSLKYCFCLFICNSFCSIYWCTALFGILLVLDDWDQLFGYCPGLSRCCVRSRVCTGTFCWQVGLKTLKRKSNITDGYHCRMHPLKISKIFA